MELRAIPVSRRLSGAPPYRLFGGMRCGLACMVLAQHGLLLLPASGREVFYRLELGAVAVTVFFALSGFVVAEAVSEFYAGRPAQFLANRALRILPLFIAALGLTVAVESWFFSRGQLVPLDGAAVKEAPWGARVILGAVLGLVPGVPVHLLNAQGVALIPFAWTLRIECGFYLLAAVACAVPVGGRGLRRAAVAVYLVFGLFVWRHAALPQQILCVPLFAFGVCAYWQESSRRVWAGLHLAALGGCALLAFTYWGQRGHPALWVQLPLLGALFGGVLVLGRVRAPGWVVALDRRLGALSYPLYIGHGVVLMALRNVSEARGWGVYGVGMVASVGLAMALLVGVDRPLGRVRERIRKGLLF